MNRRPRKPQFWNANDLATKKTELEEFVQRHQLDAVLIGETHLRASNRLSLQNFRVHRTDREGAHGGGTAILIKSTIDHHADLALNLNNQPGGRPGQARRCLQSAQQAAIWRTTYRRSSTPGERLFSSETSTPCIHRGTRGARTHAAPVYPDVLDIVVMKDVAQFHQLTVLNELSSDHNPVLLQLGQAAPEDEEPRMRQTVSWPAFANHLSAHIGPITAIGGPIELEAAVRQVTERVSDSVRYATNTTRAVDDRAFIPREVRDLIREKNRLRRQWQRTLNPAAKAEYNRTARQTKVALDEFRNNRWGDFMERASESPSEFWRAVKALKGQRVPVPPIHGDTRRRGTLDRQTVSWPAFMDHLSANTGPITAIGGPIELETAVRQVTERLSGSLRYTTNTSRAIDDRAFIPREKNRLRRQWQRTLYPVLKAEYNRMARRTNTR
ncbi:hypothetical protein Trydic_g5349 [Trypoxylus dichotomus]